MADLDKRSNRKSWLEWAIEFVRRGLWPDEIIIVHGPHGPDAPYMWGETGARVDGSDDYGTVTFRTANGITGIHDLQSVRIKRKDGLFGYETFPLLPKKSLSPGSQRWLKVAGCSPMKRVSS